MVLHLDSLEYQWRIQVFFWLPGNPPPPTMIFLQPLKFVTWKPPLRPTLDTPLNTLANNCIKFKGFWRL